MVRKRCRDRQVVRAEHLLALCQTFSKWPVQSYWT